MTTRTTPLFSKLCRREVSGASCRNGAKPGRGHERSALARMRAATSTRINRTRRQREVSQLRQPQPQLHAAWIRLTKRPPHLATRTTHHRDPKQSRWHPRTGGEAKAVRASPAALQASPARTQRVPVKRASKNGSTGRVSTNDSTKIPALLQGGVLHSGTPSTLDFGARTGTIRQHC